MTAAPRSEDEFQPTPDLDTSARTWTGRRWLHLVTEPRVLFPLLAVVMVSVLWFASLNLSRQEYENAHSKAIATSQELLDTYEAQVLRVLREIDHTLKSVQYARGLNGDGQATLDDLRDRDLLPPDIVFIVSMTNADGDIVASTRSSRSTVPNRDIVQQAGLSDDLSGGRLVRFEDEWWLRFSRDLVAPDSSFAGVALVEVEASFFVSGYDASKLGEAGVLGVLGMDGVFRVKRSGEQIAFGDSVDYQSVVSSNLQYGETESELLVNSWDNVPRYTNARELFDFPLAVIVGLSEAEQMAPAEQRVATYRFRTAGGSIVLVLVLGVLGTMSWKLEDLRKRERDYRLAQASRVEHLAYHDGLTGLPNRSFMSKLLHDRIRQSSRYGRTFALLFLDLDGFKQINDSLGHDAGDDLLCEVAKRLEDALRKTDTVARMGGDEFMVLLPELESETQATTVAVKIVSMLAEPVVLLGQKFNVTASVGISVFPLDGEDEQTLMKNADIAMYAAKDAGKNNFRYFSRDMSKAAQERINLESGLRQALARDEFELHYQARRDLRTGSVTGMEALLRWNHPEFGTIGPNKFLRLAEETGLILPIGKWVLRTACRQSTAWRKEGLPGLSVAVNLSARQFFDIDLVDDVHAILQENGMAPELLELEISEAVLARNTLKTLPVLQRIKQLGVKITVDNFGTGYSALSMLGQLPLDSIKIDRLFLREDSGDKAARDVIDGILAMGRVLSPSIVAHGVETKEQVEFLRQTACDHVQGFFFGKPFRADDVAQMLRAEELLLADSLPAQKRELRGGYAAKPVPMGQTP